MVLIKYCYGASAGMSAGAGVGVSAKIQGRISGCGKPGPQTPNGGSEQIHPEITTFSLAAEIFASD